MRHGWGLWTLLQDLYMIDVLREVFDERYIDLPKDHPDAPGKERGNLMRNQFHFACARWREVGSFSSTLRTLRVVWREEQVVRVRAGWAASCPCAKWE